MPRTIHEIVLLPHHAPVRATGIARDFSAERRVCRHAGDLLTFVTFGFRQKHEQRSPDQVFGLPKAAQRLRLWALTRLSLYACRQRRLLRCGKMSGADAVVAANLGSPCRASAISRRPSPGTLDGVER